MSFTYPIVTIATVPYSVYLDVAGADVYFGTQLTAAATTWGASVSLLKSQALLQATRMISRGSYAGAKTDSTNSLPFPRTGLTDVDGNAIDSATLPLALQYATAELAAALIVDSTLITDTTGSSSNVKRAKGGSAEVEFFGPVFGTRLPSVVSEWLAPFYGSSIGSSAPGPTGTDCTDSFACPDKFNVKEWP